MSTPPLAIRHVNTRPEVVQVHDPEGKHPHFRRPSLAIADGQTRLGDHILTVCLSLGRGVTLRVPPAWIMAAPANVQLLPVRP